jgi:hypothetical protein
LQYAYIQALNNFAASGKASTIVVPKDLSPVVTVPGTSGSTP